MELKIEAVTPQTRAEAVALRVAPEQRGFIETVEQCLKEADQAACWRPVLLREDQTTVGFAMYGLWLSENPPHGRLWLDRLLIDWRYQGRGYGAAAVRCLLKRLKEEYGPLPVYLSVYPNNQTALRLYRRFGFVENGEKDSNGETVMVCLRIAEGKES